MAIATGTAILGAAALGAGAGLLGSSSAANASEKATDKTLAVQNQQYQQTRADLAPYAQAGQAGLTALQDRATGGGGVYGDTTNPNAYADPGYTAPAAFKFTEGDYQEFYVKGSWTTLVFGVFYSDDYYAKTGESWYFSGDYSLGLIDSLTLGLHAGYTDLDEVGFLSNDKQDYTDYAVSLTYNWATVDFSIAYVGTDLDEEDVFDTELAEPVAVFTIKKAM